MASNTSSSLIIAFSCFISYYAISVPFCVVATATTLFKANAQQNGFVTETLIVIANNISTNFILTMLATHLLKRYCYHHIKGFSMRE